MKLSFFRCSPDCFLIRYVRNSNLIVTITYGDYTNERKSAGNSIYSKVAVQ